MPTIHIDHVTGAIVAPDHARAVALDTTSTLPQVAWQRALDDRPCCQKGPSVLANADPRLDALRRAHRQHILLDTGWQWAVIGLDAGRPVVHGLGHPDGDGAREAASRSPDWYRGGSARLVIPPAIAERVRAGETDCRALGIRVALTATGTIYGADLADTPAALLGGSEVATPQASPYVWLICNDLSPQRATVIRICESGPEAEQIVTDTGGGLLVQPALRCYRVQVGDRIWRTA